ncbi:MAG: hypothetical protein ACTSYS_15635 [Promethearchaeota archaeon]
MNDFVKIKSKTFFLHSFTLSIQDETIETLDFSTINIRNLLKIRFINCKFTISLNLKDIDYLEEIEINNCELFHSESTILPKSIKKIDIVKTGLKSISFINNLPSLYSLRIKRCNLKKIDGLAGCNNLKKLILNDNKIKILENLGDKMLLTDIQILNNPINKFIDIENLLNVKVFSSNLFPCTQESDYLSGFFDIMRFLSAINNKDLKSVIEWQYLIRAFPHYFQKIDRRDKEWVYTKYKTELNKFIIKMGSDTKYLKYYEMYHEFWDDLKENIKKGINNKRP